MFKSTVMSDEKLFQKIGMLLGQRPGLPIFLAVGLTLAGSIMAANEEEQGPGEPEPFRPDPRGAPSSRMSAGTRHSPEIETQQFKLRGAPAVPATVEPQASPPPSPPPVSPLAGEQALALSREKRRTIQRALTEQGFDTGGIDGVFGRNTRFAIRAFQQASGFEPTGFLTNAQVDKLLAQ